MLMMGAVLQGRYRIERILGQGGMGAVYLATEELLGGKRVAVKEMNVNIDDPTERQRAIEQFQKEARILATLDHPGLVDVTHYFEEGGKQYLVMAFIDGKTLETLLNESPGFLPVPTVLEWIDQVCDVLEYLHSHQPPIIFRDMKPSNVMLDSRNRIRLIDFGIARSFDSGKTATFIKGAGTAGFAPLEQYGRGQTTDPRTDIYAVGATLYCLLTRTLPPSSVDLVTNDETLTPPSQVNAAVPPSLEAVILTMMALKKEDRYQSMEAARQALRMARPQSDGDTGRIQGFRPRFCTNCGATAVPSQTTCGRCGAALELMGEETGKSGTGSPSTAVKPPAPVAVPSSLPEVEPTQSGFRANGNGTPAAVAAPVDPLATQMPSGGWGPGGSGWTPGTPSVPAAPVPQPATAPATPFSPLPQTQAAIPGPRAEVRTGGGGMARLLLPAVAVGVVLVGVGVKGLVKPGPAPTASVTTPATQTTVATPSVTSTVAVTSPATPPSPAGGTVQIQTTPAGATISLDGASKGTAPTALTVPPGPHTVELSMTGYHPVKLAATGTDGAAPKLVPDFDTEADVSGGMLKATLVQKGVKLKLPGRGSVVVDQTRHGAVENGSVLYLSGKHHLAIDVPGYEPFQETVAMQPGASLDVKLKVRTEIETRPSGAHLIIDGTLKSAAPFKGALTAGEHHVVATRDGYYRKETKVNVAPGKPVVVELTPLPAAPPPPPPPRYVPPPTYHPPVHHQAPPPPVREATPIRG